MPTTSDVHVLLQRLCLHRAISQERLQQFMVALQTPLSRMKISFADELDKHIHGLSRYHLSLLQGDDHALAVRQPDIQKLLQKMSSSIVDML